MTDQHVSKNPDLLHPEILLKRTNKVSDFWGSRIGTLNELDRITIFATHRCNLRCQYCNGPHVTTNQGNTSQKRNMLNNDLSMESYKHLLDDIKNHATIKHIHFTGGEPTLNKNLPAFVKMATERGILSSITTNGNANPELYRKLIDYGLTEIRISFDSFEKSDFDRIVRTKGAFKKAVNSVNEIVKMRDQEDKNIFLVLNACIGDINLDHLEKVLKFLLALNPDDAKLLVIAEDRETVLNHHNKAIIKKLHAMLDNHPKKQYVLLRKKIDNLFNPDASGLQEDETQEVMQNCFIPMTERTIDGNHYYPCSIYLRYYGNPIGTISESYETQQNKVMDFVREHDCRTDEICISNCTNCCKIFNVKTNKKLAEEVLEYLPIEVSVTDEEIQKELEVIQNLTVKHVHDKTPFLIIKPHGLQWKDVIISILAKNGLTISSSKQILEWSNCARYMYTSSLSHQRVLNKLKMAPLYEELEKGSAELLFFNEEVTTKCLLTIKSNIRKSCPSDIYKILVNGKKRKIRITAVHTPDEKDLIRENNILILFAS